MKQALKLWYKNLRFNLSASNNGLFIGFYKYFYKPSKGSISELLDIYSKSLNRNVTLIQVGANDGITHDPVHKFIKRDNWKGVLLEPQKDVFDQFLKRLYAKNKGIHTVNAALSYTDGSMTLYKIGFSDARWATGLASFDRSVLESAFDSGYIAEQCLKDGIEIPEENRIVGEEIEAISPETLLKKFSVDHIDLLQIDVEGFDYEVVKMFQIEKTKPGLIIFENSHLSEEDHQACKSLLSLNGYKVKDRGRNSVAMLNPEGVFSTFFS